MCLFKVGLSSNDIIDWKYVINSHDDEELILVNLSF